MDFNNFWHKYSDTTGHHLMAIKVPTSPNICFYTILLYLKLQKLTIDNVGVPFLRHSAYGICCRMFKSMENRP